MDLDLPSLHRRALDATRSIVARIEPDQLDDVRELLNHVVSGNWWVPPLVEGKTIEEVGDSYDGDVVGADPLGAYEASAESAASAFERPGAMDTPVAVSYGPVPGSVYAGHRFLDVLIHGWDLAVATGQDRSLDPELVAALWEVVQPQAEELKASGAFGTEVPIPEDAPLQDRLLGLLGRVP